MVNIRFSSYRDLGSIPGPAPILLFLSFCFLLSSRAAALSPDSDSVMYYTFSEVAPLAYYDLFGSVFDTNSSGAVTFFDGTSPTDMTFQKFLNSYLRNLRSIDAAIQSSGGLAEAYLKTIDSNLAFYLPRLDTYSSVTNTLLTGVHKRLDAQTKWLLDIQSSLSTISSFLDSNFGRVFSIVLADGSVAGDLTFPQYLLQSSAHLATISNARAGVPILDSNGRYQILQGTLRLPSLLGYGFTGLSYNLVARDNSTTFKFLFPNPDENSEEGGLVQEEVEVDNILDALGIIGTALQQPLAKLQYVLADDDDIAIKDAMAPVKDAVVEDFTGDGDGAISPDDVGSMAGVSKDFKDTFQGAGDIGDAFASINDGNNYMFFSQSVADDMDTVGSPSAQSEEDLLEGYVFDEDGYLVSFDDSLFDLNKYLGGVRK